MKIMTPAAFAKLRYLSLAAMVTLAAVVFAEDAVSQRAGMWNDSAPTAQCGFQPSKEHAMTQSTGTTPSTLALATFGGGCFWCMESPFEKLDGVRDVVAGYSGGTQAHATYEQVSSGRTKHVEVVQVSFDPSRIGYQQLVQAYLRAIDPTDGSGQFADRGAHYRPVIFSHDDDQRATAQTALDALKNSARFTTPPQVSIESFSAFYPAEDYHQDYHVKQPEHYQRYRQGSGRTAFLERNWASATAGASCAAGPGKPNKGAPNATELKKRLTPLQYEVTQNGATERPFENSFWDNKQAGLYVDVVSGEPLFTSLDKFESGTGWPSFSKSVASNITTKSDHELAMPRTEIRSKQGNSHLGHVFDDGPGPGGKRYCVNSAALRFVPVGELKDQGFAEYLPLFQEK